jgi:general secretion pathway protein K
MKLFLKKTNRESNRESNRGFAILVAMISAVVLSILAAAFAYAMKVETRLAANTNNDEQMIWMGRGGMELAAYVLAQEGNLPFTSLNQIWAGGPGSGPETNNSTLMNLSLKNYPLGDGTVTVSMIELESKINVNTASSQLLQQVLTSMGVDANDISVVSDSIMDWVDTDDSPRPAGAESDYYQSLDPPYYAKNAPIDDLSELRFIKGITPDMYFGSSATNVQESVFEHHKLGFGNAPGQAPDYAFGLTNVFTPYSSGKINVNTADETVLELIPGMDTTSAQNILKFRSGPDGVDGTEDDTPFQNVGQIAAAGVAPQAAAQIGTFCTTHGTTYEVHVTAHIAQQTREFTGVIFHYGNTTQIVRFYWDE